MINESVDLFGRTVSSHPNSINIDKSRNLDLFARNTIIDSTHLPEQKLIELNQDTIFDFKCEVHGESLKLILSEVSAVAPFIYEAILTLDGIINNVSEMFKSCDNIEKVKEHIDNLFENKKIKLIPSKNNKTIDLEFSAHNISKEEKFTIETVRKMTDNKEAMLLELYSIQKEKLKILKDIETYLKSNKNINKNELEKIMKVGNDQ